MSAETITGVLTQLSSWASAIVIILGLLATVSKNVRKFFGWIVKKITGDDYHKKIDSLLETILEKIQAVSDKCDENERDRLKQVIFTYGNSARKHQPISSEEFRELQSCFEKYSEKLGGNGIAHDEYNFIVEYYNNQYK